MISSVMNVPEVPISLLVSPEGQQKAVLMGQANRGWVPTTFIPGSTVMARSLFPALLPALSGHSHCRGHPRTERLPGKPGWPSMLPVGRREMIEESKKGDSIH